MAIGFIKWLIGLTLVAALFELSFNFFVWKFNRDAEEEAWFRVDSVASTRNAPLSDKEKDSLFRKFYSEYVAAHENDEIYPFFGFTYKECLRKSITLGLDLQGGMNVVVGIDATTLLKKMANDPSDTLFVNTLALAHRLQKEKGGTLLDRFQEAWMTLYPDVPMAVVFSSRQTRDEIPLDATNEQVISVLKKRYEEMFEQALRVIRSRIDRFGVVQPNIQVLSGGDKIMLELPGIKEPERIRKILQATANLEFWETFTNPEIYPVLAEIDEKLSEVLRQEKREDTASGVLKMSDTLASEQDTSAVSSPELQNPLFSLLSPAVYQDPQTGRWNVAPGPVVGYARIKDTSRINALLYHPAVLPLLKTREGRIKFLWSRQPVEGTEDVLALYAIKVASPDGRPPLDGSVIVDAYMDVDMYGMPEVAMTMNAEGATVWYNLTKANVGKYIAIVVDNMVYSAPVVKTPISGGRSSISGNFTTAEAQDLANVLKSGRLPVSVSILRETMMGPTLGKESLRASLVAFLISFVVIFAYMFIWYGTASIIVIISLIINIFLIIGTLDSLGATITMPGIAGIILALGMGVDANIIILERIKEELRAQKGIHIALEEGLRNSLSAIVDSNLTTIIAGIILYSLSSGPVQNFAVTLISGNILVIITQVFLPHILYNLAISRNIPVQFAPVFSKEWLARVNVPWLSYRAIFIAFSIIITLVSLVSLILKGVDLGVDFRGGRSFIVATTSPVTTEKIRSIIGEAMVDASGIKHYPEVKTFGNESTFKITTDYLIDDPSDSATALVQTKIVESLQAAGISPQILSVDIVGPSVAEDIQRDAIKALILAFIMMFLYILFRFRYWQFASGAIIALFHDALAVIGVFSLLYAFMPFSLEVDQTFVGAILTVIGYSINDTVIVYDRIRERFQKFKNESFFDAINKGINQTLPRTINTSLTTILVLLVLLIIGGETTRGFAFALLIGTLVGTYSSTGVASVISYMLIKKKEPAQFVPVTRPVK